MDSACVDDLLAGVAEPLVEEMIVDGPRPDERWRRERQSSTVPSDRDKAGGALLDDPLR